mmetsp:Transcript_54884/g.119535  ORF Transcript_54884/g.119535 Transcript_54884/m.119535 type:complete len:88 (+) Transcript_54884:468-731(+)
MHSPPMWSQQAGLKTRIASVMRPFKHCHRVCHITKPDCDLHRAATTQPSPTQHQVSLPGVLFQMTRRYHHLHVNKIVCDNLNPFAQR